MQMRPEAQIIRNGGGSIHTRATLLSSAMDFTFSASRFLRSDDRDSVLRKLFSFSAKRRGLKNARHRERLIKVDPQKFTNAPK